MFYPEFIPFNPFFGQTPPSAMIIRAIIKQAMSTPQYPSFPHKKLAYTPPERQQGGGGGGGDMAALMGLLGGMGGGGGGGMGGPPPGDMGMGGPPPGDMGMGPPPDDMGMGPPPGDMGMGGSPEGGSMSFTDEELGAIEPGMEGGAGGGLPVASSEAVAQVEAALAVLKEGIKKLQDALEALTQGSGETKAASYRRDLLRYLKQITR